MIIAIVTVIALVAFLAFCIVGSGNHDRDEGFDDDTEISAVDDWLRRKDKEREGRV